MRVCFSSRMNWMSAPTITLWKCQFEVAPAHSFGCALKQNRSNWQMNWRRFCPTTRLWFISCKINKWLRKMNLLEPKFGAMKRDLRNVYEIKTKVHIVRRELNTGGERSFANQIVWLIQSVLKIIRQKVSSHARKIKISAGINSILFVCISFVFLFDQTNSKKPFGTMKCHQNARIANVFRKCQHLFLFFKPHPTRNSLRSFNNRRIHWMY